MNPKTAARFDHLRRVAVFLLGVVVVLDALLDDSPGELLIGVVMIGVLPVENLFAYACKRDAGARE